MNLIDNFKQKGVHKLMDLIYPLWNIPNDDEALKITPSMYAREMQLSTEDRLSSLNNVDFCNVCSDICNCNKKSRNILGLTPRILLFQNFTAFSVNKVNITVINRSQALVYVRMLFEESLYFSIDPPLLKSPNLAPGMELNFVVSFSATVVQDYAHTVTFVAGSEKLVIPIIALGPRPLCNFPDLIVVPSTLVKVKSSTHVVVKNMGCKTTALTLTTKRPFTVMPKSFNICPDESVDITVSVECVTAGKFSCTMQVLYDSGDQLHISLNAIVDTTDVNINNADIKFPNTYVGLSTQETIYLRNKSKNSLKFTCVQHASQLIDMQCKEKENIFAINEDDEVNKKLEEHEKQSQKNLAKCTKICCDDSLHELFQENIVYGNIRPFIINPLKGYIYPNSSAEINVVFSPDEIGAASRKAYIDVEGVEDRMEVMLSGISIAPSLQLNVETLNISQLYINNVYHYEVVVSNTGPIPGSLMFRSASSSFGSVISCEPQSYRIESNSFEIFVLSFSNKNKGQFLEEVMFCSNDYSDVLKLYLKGEIIYPNLIFHPDLLDFGNVSIGSTTCLTLTITNECCVPVRGSMYIPDDGTDLYSITIEQFATATRPKLEIPQCPKQFTLSLTDLALEQKSSCELTIQFIPNLVRVHETWIAVEINGVDSVPMKVPILYNANVPTIIPQCVIDLGECVLRHQQNKVIVCEVKEFDGYFVSEEPEVECECQPSVEYQMESSEGYLFANSLWKIPISIITNFLGQQETDVRVNLFGASSSVRLCTFKCFGIPPKLTLHPRSLRWGEIEVLQPETRILTIKNASPIDVSYTCSFDNTAPRIGLWSVDRPKGEFTAETDSTLEVTTTQRNAQPFKQKLLIHIENCEDIVMKLSGVSEGCSITIGELKDHADLGYHFTHNQVSEDLMMTNHSTHLQVLEWTSQAGKQQNRNQDLEKSKTFFKLSAMNMSIGAGDSYPLTITAMSKLELSRIETWYLCGTVQGGVVKKKVRLMDFPIKITFVTPKLEFSVQELNFTYDSGPYECRYLLSDYAIIKNVSKLPLNMNLSINSPFVFDHQVDGYLTVVEEKAEDCSECNCKCPHNSEEFEIEDSYEGFQYVDHVSPESVADHLLFSSAIENLKSSLNLKHGIKQYLRHQESMKVLVYFDPPNYESLRCKTFSDKIVITFLEHKNIFYMGVNGSINYPNVFLEPSYLDFGAIPTGGSKSEAIKIINHTTLTIRYELYWTDFIVGDLIEEIGEDSISRINCNNCDRPVSVKCLGVKATCGGGDMEETINCDNCSDRNSIHTNADEQSTIDTIDEFMSAVLNVEKPCESINEQLSLEQSCHCFEASVDNIIPLGVDQHSQVQKPDDIFSISPERGILLKGEEHYINIYCIPYRNTKFKATLTCDVLGGPSEPLSIAAISSDMKFTLDSSKVDFSYCLYHNNITKSVTLTNAGHFPIKFTTKATNIISQGNKARAAVKEVAPVAGVLKNYRDTSEIQILVSPGILGEFEESVFIKIEHIEKPVTIDLVGYGSFPQVYISLKKKYTSDMHNEQGYLAICDLTTKYLDRMREVFSDRFLKQKYVSEDPKEVMVVSRNNKNDCIVEDDWFSCSCDDNFPSVMHIEMSVERLMLMQHLKEYPSRLQAIFSSSKWNGPIPKFLVQPYELDFGVVVIGTQVTCKAEVVNYSPSPVRLMNHKKQVLPTWLRADLGTSIQPYSSSIMTVIFEPTNEHFNNLEENVATTFNVDVPYGASIPIMVKATCVVPYLHTGSSAVHFGCVKCGDKTVCNFPIKNIGKVDVLWSASVGGLKKCDQNVITLSNKCGILKPDSEDWISIEFTPAADAMYATSMILKVDKNPTPSTIAISGKGMVPKYELFSEQVKFLPTLPWSQPVHCYFGVTNPCDFPIEIVFSDFNVKNEDESAVYEIMKLFYNDRKELLIPRRFAGESIPKKILEFFTKIVDRRKDMADPNTQGSQIFGVKRIKGRGKVLKSPNTPKEPPRTIEEEISFLQVRGDDPLKEIWDDQNPNPEVGEVDNGIIILFHGSPYTESDTMEIAYSVGRKLQLPVINIDNALIDALLTIETPAQNELKLIIENAYDSVPKKSKKKSGKKTKKENPDTEVKTSSEDEYDMLRMKMEVVLAGKTKGKPKSPGKRNKNMPTDDDFINTDANQSMLPTDLTMRVLSTYLNQSKYKCGFIVDSLTSLLFKKPEMALIHILQCRPKIRQIEISLSYISVNEWLKKYEEAEVLPDGTDVKIYPYLGAQSGTSSDENVKNNDLGVYVLKSTPRKRQSKSSPSTEKKGKVKVKDLYKTSMSNKFKEFENSLQTILLITNNWSMEKCQIEYPLHTLWGSLLIKKVGVPNTEKGVDSSEHAISLDIWRYPFCTYKDCIIKAFTEKFAFMRYACETAITISEMKCYEYSILKPLSFPGANNKDDKFQWQFLDEPLLKKCICVERPKHWLDAVELNEQEYVRSILTTWACTECKEETPKTSSTNVILDTSSEIAYEINSVAFATNEEEQSKSNEPIDMLSSIMPLDTDHYPASYVLEPGDLLRCRLTFSPGSEGFYKQSYGLGIVGCPQSVGKVDVVAIADVPRLDCRPKKMFHKFIRQSVNTISYSQAFLDDRKVFQFGPVFIKSSLKESTTFWMKNVSLMPASVEYTLLYCSAVFTLDHEQHHIKPGEKLALRVYAAPQVTGSTHNTVLCSIKHNPKVFTINMDCVGVEPDVILSTNLLDFSKILLHRKETRSIVLTNSSVLPVKWKIPFDEQVGKQFMFSKSSGTLKVGEQCSIDINYMALQVELVKITLNIQIHELCGHAAPLMSHPLQICAECYDVSVDCSFTSSDDTHLLFGPCKMNIAKTLSIFLLNRGKYDIHYKIKKIRNVKHSHFLKSMKIENNMGVLPPTMKTIAIDVSCRPAALVDLHNAPAFTCTLIDGVRDDRQTVIAQFPINITIHSYYNTFIIKPELELDFHAVKIGESLVREIIITNTTITPIKYEMLTPEVYASRCLQSCNVTTGLQSAPGTAPSTARKSRSKKGKSPRSPEEKSPRKLKDKSPEKVKEKSLKKVKEKSSKKVKDKSPKKLDGKSPRKQKEKSPRKRKDKSPEKSISLQAGCYYIENCVGILPPDTSKSIPITFSPKETETHVEVVRVFVEGSDPAGEVGAVRLAGRGATPSLAVWEIDRTFHSHFIVKDLSHHRPSAEGTPHCVFVEQSASLHFMNVLVNSSFDASLLLYNDGLISATASLSLKLHRDSDLSIFTVSPKTVCIDPSESKDIFVNFAPTALEVYKSILEVKIEGTSDVYRICLTGEGIIPRIEIIEPQLTNQEPRLLTFPPTFVDNVGTGCIVLRNIGVTLCAVLLCIEQGDNSHLWNDSHEPCFAFTLEEGSNSNLREFDKDTKLHITMLPDSESSLSVVYRPKKRGKLGCTIKIIIADNPYESVEIACEGMCFVEDVTIRGLPIVPLQLVDDDVTKVGNNSVTTVSGSRVSESKSNSTQRSATIASSQSVRSAQGKNKMSRKQKKSNKTLSKDISTIDERPSPKYIMDLGGCDLNMLKRRTLILVNHSKTVYKFEWILPSECVVIEPSAGYILPEEETDVALTFHSNIPIYLYKVPLICMLIPSDTGNTSHTEMKGSSWDEAQTVTIYQYNTNTNESGTTLSVPHQDNVPINELEPMNETNTLLQLEISFSAIADYCKYTCSLEKNIVFEDTLMYQTRYVEFTVHNNGTVPLKIVWKFLLDGNYPMRKRSRSGYNVMTQEEHDSCPGGSSTLSIKESCEMNTLFSEDLYRSEADTCCEEDFPFDVTPSHACIDDGELLTFRITFSPMEAFEYKVTLESYVANLDPGCCVVCASVVGRALVPYCHLELEESDYSRTDSSLPHNTRVVQFNVLGIGCYKKMFNIVNPTTETYTFKWKKISKDNDDMPLHCNLMEGILESGSTEEICFTFNPNTIGVNESHWIFSIPQYELEVKFLIVGIVRQPRVIFSPSVVKLSPMLIDNWAMAEFDMINEEDEALNFDFKCKLLPFGNYQKMLVLKPENGTLEAKSTTTVSIKYKCTEVGSVCFKIPCNISYSKEPLYVCVQSTWHSIEPVITYTIDNHVCILQRDNVNDLQLGKLPMNQSKIIKFLIQNDGTLKICYNWEFVSDIVQEYMDIAVDNEAGQVLPGEEKYCTLKITIKKSVIKNYPLCLHILQGGDYNIFLSSAGAKPNFTFSFTSHDFQKCVIEAPPHYYHAVLTVHNKSDHTITIHINFEDLPELRIALPRDTRVISPDSSMAVPIFFQPTQEKKYQFKIPFIIDELYHKNILIEGEGVGLHFDLVDGCQQSYDFGEVRVGERVNTTIKVISKTKVPIKALFYYKCLPPSDDWSAEGSLLSSDCLPLDLSDMGKGDSLIRGPVDLHKYKQTKESYQKLSDVDCTMLALHVTPCQHYMVPNKKVYLKLNFIPTAPVQSMDARLCMEAFGVCKTLVSLRGRALDVQLSLDRAFIQFGVVHVDKMKTSKLVLTNNSQVTARFEWDQNCLDPRFNITPGEGNIQAQSTETFCVLFRSEREDLSVKCCASCKISEHKDVEVQLYATCIDPKVRNEKAIQFACAARKLLTKTLQITNTSDCPWDVTPVIHGDGFETIKQITLNPHSVYDLPITFKPMSMASYQAQLFISPLGEDPMLFELNGESGMPEPNCIVKVQTPCRMRHVEVLPVYKLSQISEMYKVSSQIVKVVPDKFSGYFEMNGANFVNVVGDEVKYPWSMLCYVPCTMEVKTIFTNEANDTFQYCIIRVEVTVPEIQETVRLSAQARECTRYCITVKNPLQHDASFSVACVNKDLQFESPFIIPPCSEGSFKMKYSPLVVGSEETLLQLSHSQLGNFVYKLILESTPASEQTLHYTLPLGSSVLIKFLIRNDLSESAEFYCEATDVEIALEKFYKLGPKEKKKISSLFEPSNFGHQNGKVTFRSQKSGEFVYNIITHCTKSKPKGPIDIAEGGSALIEFKNVFNITKTFKLCISDKHFTVDNDYYEFTVEPKEKIGITVHLSSEQGAQNPTGTLSVECVDVTGATWKYFLRGVTI